MELEASAGTKQGVPSWMVPSKRRAERTPSAAWQKALRPHLAPPKKGSCKLVEGCRGCSMQTRPNKGAQLLQQLCPSSAFAIPHASWTSTRSDISPPRTHDHTMAPSLELTLVRVSLSRRSLAALVLNFRSSTAVETACATSESRSSQSCKEHAGAGHAVTAEPPFEECCASPDTAWPKLLAVSLHPKSRPRPVHLCLCCSELLMHLPGAMSREALSPSKAEHSASADTPTSVTCTKDDKDSAGS